MKDGRQKAGYTVVSVTEVVEAKALPPGCSAQRAELITLIRALELGKGKVVNIYTDSKYACSILHAHGAIWKERGMLTSGNKQIINWGGGEL